ncbi:LptF/LptG family permease [Candidatus Riflebacteria bacterium]
MRILDRYLFFQLVKPFFLGLMGFVVLLSVDPLNRALANIINDRIDYQVVIRWFIFRIPQDLVLAFPMSTLLACLLIFSRLSRDGELTALKASGISFYRMMLPIFAFALFSSTLTFLFNEFIIPISAVRRRAIRKAEMLGQQTWQDKRNIILRTGPDELAYAKRISPSQKKMEFLVYFRFKKNMCKERLTARFGFYNETDMNWHLKFVNKTRYNDSGRMEKEESFKELTYNFQAKLNDFTRDYDHPQEQSMRELWRWINYFERNPAINILPLKVEFYAKSSLPISCLIFCLIGASLGVAKIRSGGFVGFGISVVIVFCYYVLLTISLSMGKNGFLPPHIAAWLPNFVFFSICLFLIDDVNMQK